MTPSGVLTGGILIFCLIMLVLLLILALVLIAGLRKQRREMETLKASPVKQPFPSDAAMPKLRPSGWTQAAMDDAIRTAYAQWLKTYVMVDSEPGRVFIYSGVGAARAKGRPALAASSLGQALGMLVQILIAGEDPLAQDRFDRLFLFLLAHPSAESADLAAWQSFPDERRSQATDADLYAESLITLALTAAPAQWPEADRVYYNKAAGNRARALMPILQKSQSDADQRDALPMGWGFEALAAWTGETAWRDLGGALKELPQHSPLAWMQLWQQGLDALFSPEAQGGATEAVNAARRLLDLPIEAENDTLRSYTYADSPLLQFAASIPMLASLEDQAVTDQAWEKLTATEPWRKDGFGASLRLLGMMILAGRFWLPELDWKSLPKTE